MRNRIRNILLETLILESPLFKAVAIKVFGRVYVGDPEMFHAHLDERVVDEKFNSIDEYQAALSKYNVECGYITMDGNFVTRKEAGEMVDNPDSLEMRDIGALVET